MLNRAKLVDVNCCFCKRSFNRTVRRDNEAKKYGWNAYCSKNCERSGKSKKIGVNCSKCGSSVMISDSIYRKSKSGNFFCNRSCSAKFNNKKREMKEETKDKIRKSLVRKAEKRGCKSLDTICPVCAVEFRAKNNARVCCSKECGYIHKLGSLPYSKDDVINRILFKYLELERTPQRRECERRLVSSANRLFTTWNKAVKECGLKPNPSKYQKVRLKCNDGHISDSISEKTVDDWFYGNGMQHERNKKYPMSNMDCDFYFARHDLWVEYFGLAGQVDEYDIIMNMKKDIALKNGLSLVSLLPSDLYPNVKLEEIFKKYI